MCIRDSWVVADIGSGTNYHATPADASLEFRLDRERVDQVLEDIVADHEVEVVVRQLVYLIGNVADQVDQLPDDYFDLVVCNDVLEHLVDPFTVQSKLKRCISRRGVVVSSTPNIRYYPTVSYTHLRAHETVLDLVC